MKLTLKILLVLCMLLPVSACGVGGFSNKKIRYKMTVTIETPEGIKTGSAVREAARYTEPSILPDQGGVFYSITKGEAVVVDLEQRGVLFVLLDGSNEPKTVFKSFYQQKSPTYSSIVLTDSQYPTFVHFANPSDPKSIESVLIEEPCSRRERELRNKFICIKENRFEEIYGEGVFVKSVVISPTNDDIVFGQVERYLQWFKEPEVDLGLKSFDPQSADRAKYIQRDKFQVKR